MATRGTKPTLDRRALMAALDRHQNSVSCVAQEVGLTRQAVYAALKAFGIRRKKATHRERSERMRRWWRDRKADVA